MRGWTALLGAAVFAALLACAPAQAQRLADRHGAHDGRPSASEALRLARDLTAAAQPGSAARGSTPRTVHLFGDSLSDNGNAYVLLGALFPWLQPPYAVPRFSNGPIWPDHVARVTGLRMDPEVAGGTNHALGSATIHPSNYYTRDAYATGVAMVERHLAANGGRADPHAIYVVWLGHNDLDPPAAFTQWNFDQLVALIDRLHRAGARRFLVPNVQNLGTLPTVVELGLPAYAQALSEMTVLFNGLLATLPARFPEAQIRVADVHRLEAAVSAWPRLFGFTDARSPCWRPPSGAVCADPDRHWFWDTNHPTTRAHQWIAALLLADLVRLGAFGN